MRDEFLRTVEEAVRIGNQFRVARRSPDAPGSPDQTGGPAAPHEIARIGPREDLAQHAIAELQAVGATARLLADRAELMAALEGLLDRIQVRRVLLGESPVLHESGVVSLLERRGIDLINPGRLAAQESDQRRDAVFAADLGITVPDWVVAETGSLVHIAGPHQTRSGSLLPPVHVAVVPADALVSDLVDLDRCLRDHFAHGLPPGNVALVTGPSKTGDIELKLTTGVHGPGELHVFFLRKE